MTVQEKRGVIGKHCLNTNCDYCVLGYDENNWCLKHSINRCDEKYLDEALELIGKQNESEPTPTEPVEDMVNKPSHYNHGMECIDEMILVFGIEAVMTFCKLNVWKYRKRALHKNGLQDIDKSNWYINKYQELARGVDNG